MSVEPGFGGQAFMPEVVDKLKVLKKIISEKKLKIDLEIDGGINFKNAKLVKEAGQMSWFQAPLYLKKIMVI